MKRKTVYRMRRREEQTPRHTGISRRELLQAMALGCAGLLSNGLLAGASTGYREAGGPVRKGQSLSEAQMKLLRELVETIIPVTDTPGAADTDTHGFIDDQLANCRAPEEAKQFISGLDQFDAACRKQWNTGFDDLSAPGQQAAMRACAQHRPPFEALPGDFFSQLKALTVYGYYSSEAGASQELVFLPVPGGFQGDFKLSDNGGKAFSQLVL